VEGGWNGWSTQTIEKRLSILNFDGDRLFWGVVGRNVALQDIA
jgi:hypothetical protein